MARRELLNEAQLAMVRAVVRAAMERLGKQAAVAAETGIQQQQVSKILRGEKVGLGPAMQLAERGLLDMAALMQVRDAPARPLREPLQLSAVHCGALVPVRDAPEKSLLTLDAVRLRV